MSTPRAHTPRRASIIIVVLIMMAVASMAMVIFMEKVANDTTVEIRAADASRMRLEAYSAMETVIGTLEDYRSALGALRSPAEGWGVPPNDALAFAGYELADFDENGRPRYYGINPDYTVEVTFEDESGKLSLPNINATRLNNLFAYWGLETDTAAKLTDALLGWMRKDYISATAGAPQAQDYSSGDLPFLPPGRTLRSFDELASIDFVRDFFYDENGRPNDYYRRFTKVFSLYDFPTTNINGATPDVLGALGSQDPDTDEKLSEFINGADPAAGGVPGWFASRSEISQLLGDSPATALGVTISALRIIVTVRQNQASYRLNCLISVPPGGNGAKIPSGWSQLRPAGAVTSGSAAPGSVSAANMSTSANASSSSVRGASQAAALGGGAATSTASAVPVANLRYPYVYLEVRENDQLPPPSPIISTDTSDDQ